MAYKPFNREENSTEELNEVIDAIYEKTEKFTFSKMQNIFLNLIIGEINPPDIVNSLTIINNIPTYANQPARQSIESMCDGELKEMLFSLLDSNISSLRNKVVHKFAYRPSEREAENAIDEIRRIIFGLARVLEIGGDNINTYILNA